jgi:hypothetical protein
MHFVTNFSSDKTVPADPTGPVRDEVQKQQPSNKKLRQEVAVRNFHTDQQSVHESTKSFTLT